MPRRITLQVPSGTDIPEFFTNASPEDVLIALQLGANLYSTMRTLRLQEESVAIAALEEEKAVEIARIHAAAATAQERLNVDLQAAREARAQVQHVHQEQLNKLYAQQSNALEEERATSIRVTKATYEGQMARNQEQIASLQSRLQLVEESRTAEVKRAEERAEERTQVAMQLVLEEKQRAMERLERERDKFTAAMEREREKFTAVIERNSEEVRTLANSIVVRKTKSSKEKGDDFEASFKGQLVATYGTCPGFAVETTASNGHGHAADLLMKLDDKSVLWEVKNYDGPVPTKEVEKFHRDMTENPTISIGVMVSRMTHITGKNNAGPKFIEFVNDRMMIYINNYDTLSETTLHDLMLVFKLYWHASRNFESQESIESAIRSLEKLRTEAAAARTAWKHHKVQNDSMMRWMTEQIEGAEERLQHALRSLQGTVTSTPLDIPPGIFRDVTDEPKSLEYIRCILEVAEPSTSSCILNDVAHLVGEKLKLSRDTVRGHIRGLLLDSAYIAQKGKHAARVAGLSLKNEFVVS